MVQAPATQATTIGMCPIGLCHSRRRLSRWLLVLSPSKPSCTRRNRICSDTCWLLPHRSPKALESTSVDGSAANKWRMYQIKKKDIDNALLAMGGKLADAAEVPVLGTAESGSGGKVTFTKTIPKNSEEAAALHAKLALLGLQLSEFLPPAEYRKLGLPSDEMNAAPSDGSAVLDLVVTEVVAAEEGVHNSQEDES